MESKLKTDLCATICSSFRDTGTLQRLAKFPRWPMSEVTLSPISNTYPNKPRYCIQKYLTNSAAALSLTIVRHKVSLTCSLSSFHVSVLIHNQFLTGNILSDLCTLFIFQFYSFYVIPHSPWCYTWLFMGGVGIPVPGTELMHSRPLANLPVPVVRSIFNLLRIGIALEEW